MAVHVLSAKEGKKQEAKSPANVWAMLFFLLSGGGCGEGSHCILVSSLAPLAWQY